MPKKFQGENSKANAARARKDAIKQAEIAKKEKEEADAFWKDDDKHVQRKQQRKEEKEKKKQEVADRKATSKQLLEEEMSTLKGSAAIKPAPNKLTRAQIATTITDQKAPNPAKEVVEVEQPIVENLNRLVIDGEEARTVEEAISVLSSKEVEVDRHPERRIKAAYAAFEAENLPRVKAENPHLRLSQWKEILRKDWMKSPQNPLIQMKNS